MQPILPKLKEDTNITFFTSAGVWARREAGELKNLSEGLESGGIDAQYIDISCIPDMWARPLLFEMAIYDTKNPLHSRVLEEWRGLLAMLALKEWRNLKSLEVIPVDISEPIPASTASETASKTQLDFLEVLGRLAPSKTLSKDTSWYNLYAILFDDKPIAITSPTTLVCTAADYRNCIQNVSWFDGRFLRDPVPKLGKQEKQALASWLNQLINNLNKHQDINQGMNEFNTLVNLINQFQNDLVRGPIIPAILSDSDLRMMRGIFRHLSKPIGGIEVPSHVQLKPSPSRKKPDLLPLLVVDRAIAEQWGMADYEIFVRGTATLASFPFDSVPFLPDVRLPEHFFTEKLFLIEQQNAFPGAMKIHGIETLRLHRSPITPIIPINDELLNYITVDDLCKRVRFEQRNDSIVVKIRLPLTGSDNNGRDFEIERGYRLQENEVVVIPSVPVLEIWPNFNSTNWKAYYTYFSTTGETTFCATPYVQGDDLGVQKPESQKVEPEEIKPQLFKDNNGKIERQITRTNSFPEAMKCEFQVMDIKTNVTKSEKAGVILITQPQPLPQPTKSWTIGVDFGTTATNVYVNDNHHDPFPLGFEKRFLQVTDPSEARRTCLYDDFLPGESKVTPFLSFFHDFLKTTEPRLRPLLDGHIYFLRDHKTFDATTPGMTADLKWSEEHRNVSNVRIRTRAFLEQLCLQCAAEAISAGAKEVNWRFSFPTAFSVEDQEEFRIIWGQITQACSLVTGLSQTDTPPEDETESVASARFFAEHSKVKAPFATGTVCIDIGGGTSDISIWQDNMLCWQTSLRFAGRDIFLNPLYEKPDLLKIFNVDESELKRLERVKGNRKAFYAQADALITYEGEKWLANLPVYSAESEMKKFLQLIAIGLSGLYYYVGSLLHYLHKESKYKEQMPNVYVAGNGARIFHWLAKGVYDKRSPINVLFKDVLLKASDLKVDRKMFEVRVSPYPKSEAAFGLICKGTTLKYDESVKTHKEVLAGEVFMENGKQHNWLETLDAKRLTKGLEVSSKLERLEDFIQTFDAYARSQNAVVLPIVPNDVLMDHIYKSLSQTLANFRGLDENTIHIEPVFISALKALLEEKTREWTSKTS